MTKQYRAKSGRIQYKPSDAWLIHVLETDEQMGFCLACAEEVDGVDPDAECEYCPNCYEQKVYGAENLLTRGLFYDGEDIENEAAITAHNRTTVK
jgi:hypothetical protein